VAVKENIAHSRYKQAILNAGDTDTAITCRKLLPARSLKTEFTRRLLELEDSGASAGDIRNFLGYSRARTGQIEGDLENGEAYSGASAGLIKEVLPAAEVVQELIEGYQKVIKKIT
jgi:enoyl-[acyl-carrier protein] reductase II